LTMSLIDAVLSPPPWQHLVDLEIRARVGGPAGTTGLLVVLPQEWKRTRRGRAPRAT
jgi:hypothetical protein